MSRKKGTPKTGGRRVGVPNLKTQTLQQFLDEKGFFVPEKILELIPKLEDKAQSHALLELMQYLYPKRKAVEHSGPDGNPIEHNHYLAEFSEEEIIAMATKVLETKAAELKQTKGKTP